MAGNVSIGNDLTVGNNAIIGNSLSIGGVLLNGNLVANVVTAGTIANNAVTAGTIAANAVTANTIAANAVVAGTIAANAVVAGTIAAGAVTADKIQANSITATQISTAYLYTGNLVSFGATVGNVSSPGYWLAFTSGDARFGGNVSIGANLNVAGLITTGALQANTVVTTTIQPNSISGQGGISYNNVVTVVTTPAVPSIQYITDTFGIITAQEANQSTYIWAGVQVAYNFSGFGAGESLVAQVSLIRLDYPSLTNQVDLASFQFVFTGPLSSETNNIVFPGYYDEMPTVGQQYLYIMEILNASAVGSFTITSILAGTRSIIIQTLKR
jgi:hypothetical protein